METNRKTLPVASIRQKNDAIFTEQKQRGTDKAHKNRAVTMILVWQVSEGRERGALHRSMLMMMLVTIMRKYTN